MPPQTTQFWDRVARMSREPGAPGPTERRVLQAAQAFVDRDSVVLDVGCGTGGLTLGLASGVAAVHAIDSSAGMVAVAQARVAAAGVRNVQVCRARLADLADRDGAFTVVTMFNVLHYIDDVPAVTRQVAQLLAPGGVFLSSTACLGERRSVARGLTGLLTTLRVMPAMHAFKRAELVGLIADGGLELVASQPLSALPEYFIVARKAASSPC